MRKLIASLLLLAVFAPAAFAHGGKSHRLMGTVAHVHGDQLMVNTTEGKEATVKLTAETTYERDGKAVDRSALVAGARVSIQLDESDEEAVKVKIGSGGSGEHHGH